MVFSSQQALVKTMFSFLEHPIIGAYFAAKEHVAYYRSPQGRDARDFHEFLIPVLRNFLEQVSTQNAAKILDDTMDCTP